jgi:septum formation protein
VTSKPILSTLPNGDLVLASASATRVKLLKDAGIGFYQYPVSIDEGALRAAAIAENIPARDIAVMLAEMKASVAVQRLNTEHSVSAVYVLGCDQILVCDDIIYSKPKDIVTAKSQLLALSGKTHQLFTAGVLFQSGKRIWHHLSVADMTMRHFDDGFIDFYLDQLGETAFFSPASYQIESIGAQLFSQIKGCHYSILGIPLLELISILREHGLSPPDMKSQTKSENKPGYYS